MRLCCCSHFLCLLQKSLLTGRPHPARNVEPLQLPSLLFGLLHLLLGSGDLLAMSQLIQKQTPFLVIKIFIQLRMFLLQSHLASRQFLLLFLQLSNLRCMGLLHPLALLCPLFLSGLLRFLFLRLQCLKLSQSLLNLLCVGLHVCHNIPLALTTQLCLQCSNITTQHLLFHASELLLEFSDQRSSRILIDFHLVDNLSGTGSPPQRTHRFVIINGGWRQRSQHSRPRIPTKGIRQ
mmetsp:Transcript_18549/g.32260  ORF Transcript_18549/g.32260 Transcript_18549/m.32260 type:complete len:235 (+) Transcript_18549:2433-3137(+)